MKSLRVTIQMKAIEQYFPVVLFVMLYKVVLTFEFVDEIPGCDHLNECLTSFPESTCPRERSRVWKMRDPGNKVDECCSVGLSCVTVYSALQGGSNFKVCE